MKIALVLDHWDPSRGGLESYAASWASWLQNRGHEVYVVAMQGASPGSDAVSLHLVDAVPGRIPRARRLEAQARALAPDIVHDFGAGLGGDLFHPHHGSRHASRAGEMRSRHLLSRWRNRVSPLLRRHARELDALEAMQTARSTIVACSDAVARDLCNLPGVGRERVFVHYNNVDTKRFIPVEPTLRRRLRTERGWAESDTVLLQVAHNFRLKGVATSVRAAARLNRQGFPVRLVIAGRGPDPTAYHALAQRLGIADRVTFVGETPEIERLYAAADALVHPTFYDACSLTSLEAWSTGLPTALSCEDGASGLLTDGVQGWLIRDPGDDAEVAFQMKRLIEPDLRGAMGTQARALACHHDRAEAFRRLEALCLALCER